MTDENEKGEGINKILFKKPLHEGSHKRNGYNSGIIDTKFK